MKYTATWESPIGTLTIASDGEFITGLWMEKQAYFAAGLSDHPLEGTKLSVIQKCIHWLECYFQGNAPSLWEIPFRPSGTPFQCSVWDQLRRIPFGETRTYGQIAAALEATRGLKAPPRAVGNAVGKNPISSLIPCHRVIGANGSMTGYAGGIERKEYLLKLEQRSGTTP